VKKKLFAAISSAAGQADSPHAQVEEGFRAFFHWVSDDHDAFMLLFGSGVRQDDEFAEAQRRVEVLMAEAIAALIQADITPAHRELLAFGLVGVAETTSRRLVAEGRPFDPDLVAQQIADLAWAGLRNVRRVG